jgi:hypothetical protein
VYRLRVWECRSRNFSMYVYFSPATCFSHSTILKREYTIFPLHILVIRPSSGGDTQYFLYIFWLFDHPQAGIHNIPSTYFGYSTIFRGEYTIFPLHILVIRLSSGGNTQYFLYIFWLFDHPHPGIHNIPSTYFRYSTILRWEYTIFPLHVLIIRPSLSGNTQYSLYIFWLFDHPQVEIHNISSTYFGYSTILKREYTIFPLHILVTRPSSSGNTQYFLYIFRLFDHPQAGIHNISYTYFGYSTILKREYTIFPPHILVIQPSPGGNTQYSLQIFWLFDQPQAGIHSIPP